LASTNSDVHWSEMFNLHIRPSTSRCGHPAPVWNSVWRSYIRKQIHAVSHFLPFRRTSRFLGGGVGWGRGKGGGDLGHKGPHLWHTKKSQIGVEVNMWGWGPGGPGTQGSASVAVLQTSLPLRLSQQYKHLQPHLLLSLSRALFTTSCRMASKMQKPADPNEQ